MLGAVIVLSFGLLGVFLSLALSPSCIYPQEGQQGVETTHIPEEARKESEIFWEEQGFDDVEGKPLPTP